MECWFNPDKSITPIFQHYNSQIESVSNSLRLALCTLLVDRGATVEEGSSERVLVVAELVINLRTAKQINLTIPSSVLTKTDSVIK